MVDEPSGRLGDTEPNEEDLKDGRSTLDDRRDTPTPSSVEPEGTVGCPGGDDGAEVPGGVVEGGSGGSVGWESELSDEDWSGDTGEGETEADEESGT